ncbi:MAG: PspC domain-containing protein [Flavobacteriaceae bacterium]|nr:PspC domain-containing protein [Flavobacteriaceae bacterium]
METQNKLHRSNHRMIGGVCAGIAEYFGWDITIFRIVYLVVSVLSAAFPGTIVYIILWLIMPKRS